MSNVSQILRRIQCLQRRYQDAGTGKESLIRLIYEWEVAKKVYNSNAIENSTLSLDETDKILRAQLSMPANLKDDPKHLRGQALASTSSTAYKQFDYMPLFQWFNGKQAMTQLPNPD